MSKPASTRRRAQALTERNDGAGPSWRWWIIVSAMGGWRSFTIRPNWPNEPRTWNDLHC